MVLRGLKTNKSYLTPFIHLRTPPPLTLIRTSLFLFFSFLLLLLFIYLFILFLSLCKFQFLVLHSICFIKINLQTLDLKFPSKLRWMQVKVVHDSKIIHLDRSLNSVMTIIPHDARSWCVQNEDIFKFIIDPKKTNWLVEK